MPAQKRPQVSVILPVYNAAPYLEQCFESILSQSFSDFEIVAVNDGSNDHSYDLLKKYAKADNRVKLFRNSANQGVSRTLNKAVSVANGKYLARMDADDIMYPNRLHRQCDFLDSNPEHVLVGGQVRLVDEKGILLMHKRFPLEHSQIYKLMYLAMPVEHGTLMINRSKLSADFSWYDESVFGAEDLDLLFRLIHHGKFANLPDLLIDYRQHPKSLTHLHAKRVFHVAYGVRQKAIREYEYKPTISARFVSELQRLTVKILPRKLVSPVYLFARQFILKTVRPDTRAFQPPEMKTSSLLKPYENKA